MISVNISDLAAQFASLAAMAVIFFRCEPVLNAMCERTCRRINSAFFLLVAGSFGGFWTVLAGEVPSWPMVILLVGVALLLWCDRRMGVMVRRGGRRVES